MTNIERVKNYIASAEPLQLAMIATHGLWECNNKCPALKICLEKSIRTEHTDCYGSIIEWLESEEEYNGKVD